MVDWRGPQFRFGVEEEIGRSHHFFTGSQTLFDLVKLAKPGADFHFTRFKDTVALGHKND